MREEVAPARKDGSREAVRSTSSAPRASGLAGRVLDRVSRRDNASGRPMLGWLPSVGHKWTQSRDMPVPPRQSFRQWWKGRSR